VPIRIHGEHGWDVFDPDGTSRKYRLLRRTFGRFVKAFVTVSEDLRRWLVDTVRIRPDKVTRIWNGVDTERFRPRRDTDPDPLPDGFRAPGSIVVGSVTRFSEIKDPLNLVEAFIRARAAAGLDDSLRLVMVGDGALHAKALARLAEAGAASAAWLPGSRDDIPEILRSFDIFVLGSLREGISNTILEAMASGLPVIATATGGNLELVQPGCTGRLVPPADPASLAAAIVAYAREPSARSQHGREARARVLEHFSLGKMLEHYRRLYEESLAEA
ncbi:MAG TPA: glycosyltransferase, partial [Gammaproteobacteria bacterium]|nr:glycosyltransferase [Gammaproteobacteria bacterium]